MCCQYTRLLFIEKLQTVCFLRVRGLAALGAGNSLSHMLISVDGLCNSQDHMIARHHPRSNCLYSGMCSLPAHANTNGWPRGKTKGTRSWSVEGSACSFSQSRICLRGPHLISKCKKEQELLTEEKKKPKQRRSLLRTLYVPAERRVNESAGDKCAGPWRDGSEAFVLGAGAASQKVKQRCRVFTVAQLHTKGWVVLSIPSCRLLCLY